MLLLDSMLPGWERIKGRIVQTAREQGLDTSKLVLDDIIKPIVYPACIQK